MIRASEKQKEGGEREESCRVLGQALFQRATTNERRRKKEGNIARKWQGERVGKRQGPL